jgi:predicted nucleotidyltransferase
MPIAGIIAEYNPLHNGHCHHIAESRRLIDADAVVCVMSGNFTQRGEPALVNKWARTEMALAANIDLVFELPVAFAARSAYHFARGAVVLLQKTGLVTHLCFGSESGDLRPLREISNVIRLEHDEYQAYLKKYLAAGNHFARSRTLALDQVSDSEWELPEIMSSPNNILGIEYLRVLSEENSSMIPVTVPRLGAGYHEPGEQQFSSATFIREQMDRGKPPLDITGLPSFSARILQREFEQGRGPVLTADLTQLILHNLRNSNPDDLAMICDVNEGLENRLLKASSTASNLKELITGIKTKRYSRTRINRVLLYHLLGFTKEKARLFDQNGPLYLRLLGFSPKGEKILHEMKTKSLLPIVSRTGRFWGDPDLDPISRDMLALDILATDLYALAYRPYGRKGLDFLHGPLSPETN